MDEQLHATHVILGYKPISTSFQSTKYVIKAKDPRLQQINVAIPGFLGSPPPTGIHPIELPIQRAFGEEVTSSYPAPEEEVAKVIEVTDSKEDFMVFDRSSPIKSPNVSFSHLPSAQVSSNQEPSNIPKAMVLQRKKSINLLELLESHSHP